VASRHSLRWNFVSAGSEARNRADPCKTGLIEAVRRAAAIQQCVPPWATIPCARTGHAYAERWPWLRAPVGLELCKTVARRVAVRQTTRTGSGESLAHEPGAHTRKDRRGFAHLVEMELRVGWIRGSPQSRPLHSRIHQGARRRADPCKIGHFKAARRVTEIQTTRAALGVNPLRTNRNRPFGSDAFAN
jgi:hypothetical protein